MKTRLKVAVCRMLAPSGAERVVVSFASQGKTVTLYQRFHHFHKKAEIIILLGLVGCLQAMHRL